MTQPLPPNAVPLSAALAVMLADGEWVPIVPGSLTAVIEPTFLDPQTGQQIAPGDTWFQFLSTDAPPVVYACPMRSVAAVKLAAAVVQQPPANSGNSG